MSGLRIDPETLDFDLPADRIAQAALPQRDAARLLVLDRRSGALEHRRFADLPSYLRAGDVLVINRARVDRARLVGRKATGGRAELILIAAEPDGAWRALVRPKMRPGTELIFETGSATVVAQAASGEYAVRFKEDASHLLAREGRIPLPPYIKRDPSDPRAEADAGDYQTVYADAPGSLAAPTAGLHFTDELLAEIKRIGVVVAPLVLHVGWGTFRPIAGAVADHRMLSERFSLPAATAKSIIAAKTEGRRIIAVGTTSTRVLESLPESLAAEDRIGETDIFITPGFKFRWVDSLVTNFHVPKSTPVALTAAFAGHENLERSYASAIESGYRFFSYGDAMLILP